MLAYADADLVLAMKAETNINATIAINANAAVIGLTADTAIDITADTYTDTDINTVGTATVINVGTAANTYTARGQLPSSPPRAPRCYLDQGCPHASHI